MHWFALSVALCTLAGLAAAVLAPPAFVARAKLVVEAETISDELAVSTVRTQALEHLHIIQQRVLSRETLVDLAAELQLAGRHANADAVVRDLRRRIQVEISGDSSARGREATLLDLSVEAAAPAEAAAIANALVTLILAEDVTMRTSAARQTLDFFQNEVTRLERELSHHSQRLLAFREANRDALPDSLQFRRTRLELLQEQLAALEERHDQVDRQRRRQIRLHETIHGITETNGADATPETLRLQNLRAQRDALPENDPGRADFDRRIASLERLIEGRSEVSRGTAYERKLQEYGDELSDLEDRRALLLGEIADLEASVAATPGMAAQLEALQRDHDNLSTQYDEAVAARAVAETGDAIEMLSKGQRVAVIEQAVPPQAPDRPNRIALAVAGIGGGLVVGAGLVTALVLLTGDLRRPADLAARLGIAPFGTLPYIRTRAEIRQRRRRMALTLVGAATATLAAAAAIHVLLVPLDLLAAAALRDGPDGAATMLRDAVIRRG